jgi:hypothetical protein
MSDQYHTDERRVFFRLWTLWLRLYHRIPKSVRESVRYSQVEEALNLLGGCATETLARDIDRHALSFWLPSMEKSRCYAAVLS